MGDNNQQGTQQVNQQVSERPLVRVQTLMSEHTRQINEHYRIKVQLKEQVDDNEWKLHFCRGAQNALVELEKFLQEDYLAPALMRLQSLRVQVYCDTSERFKRYVVLKEDISANDSRLAFLRGRLSTHSSDELQSDNEDMRQFYQCCGTALALQDGQLTNESEIHYFRGMIACMDEVERIINEDLNPKTIPARVATSPGVIGPSFEGQAMDKPDKVAFPEYYGERLPNYPEYQPGSLQFVPVEQVQP